MKKIVYQATTVLMFGLLLFSLSYIGDLQVQNTVKDWEIESLKEEKDFREEVRDHQLESCLEEQLSLLKQVAILEGNESCAYINFTKVRFLIETNASHWDDLYLAVSVDGVPKELHLLDKGITYKTRGENKSYYYEGQGIVTDIDYVTEKGEVRFEVFRHIVGTPDKFWLIYNKTVTPFIDDDVSKKIPLIPCGWKIYFDYGVFLNDYTSTYPINILYTKDVLSKWHYVFVEDERLCCDNEYEYLINHFYKVEKEQNESFGNSISHATVPSKYAYANHISQLGGIGVIQYFYWYVNVTVTDGLSDVEDVIVEVHPNGNETWYRYDNDTDTFSKLKPTTYTLETITFSTLYYDETVYWNQNYTGYNFTLIVDDEEPIFLYNPQTDMKPKKPIQEEIIYHFVEVPNPTQEEGYVFKWYVSEYEYEPYYDPPIVTYFPEE